MGSRVLVVHQGTSLIMAFKAVVLVSCLALVARGQVSKIKEDLKQCASSGRDLNTCLTDLAMAIKPYMKTGVPDLGIPRADPLILDQIAFDLKNPIIDVHVEFTDNLFNGQANQLAKTVDKFLNQNTDKFIKDFQPAIAKSVSGFLKGFYNGAVRNIDVSLFQ